MKKDTTDKKNRIIIDIQCNISQNEALELVSSVINEGRISEARGIKHYCWVTVFGKYVVSTRYKKTKNSADSFIIYEQSK